MITTRQSGARERNNKVRATHAEGTNRQWMASLPRNVTVPGAVVLLGGSSVVDFRVRVAQGNLRHDLLPSFWSQVGILSSTDTFLTVPLDHHLDPIRVPSTNAIVDCALADYDDPIAFPNIAVINFAGEAAAIVEYARRLRTQRSAVDLPHLLISWLAFAWGAGAADNPLTQHVGIPAAALVETAFGIGGIELTPGVASAASCPEAIWQSAIWWHEYYEKTADAFRGARADDAGADDDSALPAAIVPRGAYAVRQSAAAVIERPTPMVARSSASKTTATSRRRTPSATTRRRRR